MGQYWLPYWNLIKELKTWCQLYTLWHSFHNFAVGNTFSYILLVSHTFNSLSQTFSPFSTLSHTSSTFSTFSQTFLTFSTLFQCFAKLLKFYDHIWYFLSILHYFSNCCILFQFFLSLYFSLQFFTFQKIDASWDFYLAYWLKFKRMNLKWFGFCHETGPKLVLYLLWNNNFC